MGAKKKESQNFIVYSILPRNFFNSDTYVFM